MKRKFDRLRESLDEFLQQDDYPVQDSRCPPAERLRSLLAHLLTLLPNPQEFRLDVALLPLECSDLTSFAELVATLVPHPEVPAWMVPATQTRTGKTGAELAQGSWARTRRCMAPTKP